MYFEYPSTVAMLLSYVKYGIHLGYGSDGVSSLEIAPFATGDSFSMHVNTLHIDFSPTSVRVDVTQSLQTASTCDVRLVPLQPNTSYTIQMGEDSITASSDADGLLRFSVSIATGGRLLFDVQISN